MVDLPLVVMLLEAFRNSDGSAGLDSFRAIADSPVYRGVLATTGWIALGSTAAVVAVGWPLAAWMSMAGPRTRRIMTVLIVLPMLVSIVVRAYSWLILLGRQGVINESLLSLGLVGSPLQLLYSNGAVVAGTAHVLLPLFVLPLYAAMSRIDTRLLLAAGSLGSGPLHRFRTVYLPLTLPSTVAAATTVFILALGFYVTPAILGGGRVTMVSTLLTVVINRLGDWALAAAISLILATVTVAGVLITRRVAGVTALETVGFTTDSEQPRVMGRRLHRLGAVYSGAVLFVLNLPVMLVVPVSFSASSVLSLPPPEWSLRWYQVLLDEPVWWEAARNSALLALVAATIALALGGAAAYGLARRRVRGEAVIRVQFLAPLLIPEIIVAVAMYIALAKVGLLGSTFGMVAAHAVLVSPLVVTILVPAMRSVDVVLERAAWTLGMSRPRAILRVVLPNIRASLAAAWGFAFITSFDTVLISFFLAGRTKVLPIALLQDIQEQVTPLVAAVATVFISSVTIVAVVVALALRVGRRTT